MNPIVAIVGRPNVGKSTLFNRIAGERIAIVEDTPGVTRDRIYAQAEWVSKHFTIIDTGGIEPDSEELIPKKMRQQAELAMDMAQVILFVVDGKAGLTPSDRDVALMLLKTKKPVLLVVNKVDNKNLPDDFYDFYELGFGEPIPVSSSIGLGTGDLLDEVVKNFPQDMDTELDEDVVKVAIVGKPNAGKSSILNRLIGEERVIVSPIAGTTRDAIDTYIEMDGKKYLFIDTAGIRRKSKVYENIEKYSVIRAYASVEKADVVLTVIDATEGISEQDSKIAGLAHDAGKASIVVVNKWDLIEKDNHSVKEYTKKIREELPFMQYCPILFVSALTSQRMGKIKETVDFIFDEASKRVATGVLNDVIGEAVMMNQPPSDKGKRLKIYYATQVGVRPPTFAIFVNEKELFHFSYQRYIENKLRENFGYEGTPLKIYVREKNRK
ncbi:GTP-binding protein [Acetoanaerobium noterae]|jgi:GTP-binding protein|uniref:GTPase Der n=3 Tax=Acetoanaerobium TaxID=186831 RepID=E3PT01_ACESD|nr:MULTISPECIES: ribosome biogenesis GTPase Der [Acetoanaerobium]MBP8762910.1 ribosome biogenesis GTPase Der [Acetoanaerobium sp.]MBP9499575.1 ribosome biogenesis GTPase Der [Acetoanaerobium sp.]MBP9562032.1 ribosome biogenesis GTPase Der [Acetoanaerobium sp.]CBH22005.1 GTPase involved in ribosome synthesis and maintenance [Acetoanaerobium sticklandii]SKB28901.1 GTP-binding protein [Acetoanaerobium noterae]